MNGASSSTFGLAAIRAVGEEKGREARLPLLPRAFFGEVDPAHRQKCGMTKKRADST
jgi:hypothetical protein